MNIFMLWMSGTAPGIFSVMIVGYSSMQIISTLTNVQQAFQIIKGVDCTLQKLSYMGICVAAVAYVLNHGSKMGILPVATGDWVSYIPPSNIQEFSVGTMI